ncbi:MAG: GntR family transcriptional regulator [Anaerolineales bacterium]
MALNHDISTPFYEQIRDYLLGKIEAGEFLPHTQIPSERLLSEQFGVSRMTVKHAITELVSHGWLYTRVGKGTFVNDTPITQQLNTLTGFSEDMAKLGKPTASRVLRAQMTKADKRLADKLKLSLGQPVAELKRLRLANQQPVAIETSYLNAQFCPTLLEEHDFTNKSLYSVLREDYDLVLSYAEQNINARMANAHEGELLDADEGFPLLHITRVTFLKDDTPIEYVESVYRGDRYIFRARLTSL